MFYKDRIERLEQKVGELESENMALMSILRMVVSCPEVTKHISMLGGFATTSGGDNSKINVFQNVFGKERA